MDEIRIKLSDSEFEIIRKASENKIVLFQDISTQSMNCEFCHASADNSSGIVHKERCPYYKPKVS